MIAMTVHGNQLCVSIKNELNDESLANQKINGLTKLIPPRKHLFTPFRFQWVLICTSQSE
jgi:hypothetical protein